MNFDDTIPTCDLQTDGIDINIARCTREQMRTCDNKKEAKLSLG